MEDNVDLDPVVLTLDQQSSGSPKTSEFSTSPPRPSAGPRRPSLTLTTVQGTVKELDKPGTRPRRKLPEIGDRKSNIAIQLAKGISDTALFKKQQEISDETGNRRRPSLTIDNVPSRFSDSSPEKSPPRKSNGSSSASSRKGSVCQSLTPTTSPQGSSSPTSPRSPRSPIRSTHSENNNRRDSNASASSVYSLNDIFDQYFAEAEEWGKKMGYENPLDSESVKEGGRSLSPKIKKGKNKGQSPRASPRSRSPAAPENRVPDAKPSRPSTSPLPRKHSPKMLTEKLKELEFVPDASATVRAVSPSRRRLENATRVPHKEFSKRHSDVQDYRPFRRQKEFDSTDLFDKDRRCSDSNVDIPQVSNKMENDKVMSDDLRNLLQMTCEAFSAKKGKRAAAINLMNTPAEQEKDKAKKDADIFSDVTRDSIRRKSDSSTDNVPRVSPTFEKCTRRGRRQSDSIMLSSPVRLQATCPRRKHRISTLKSSALVSEDHALSRSGSLHERKWYTEQPPVALPGSRRQSYFDPSYWNDDWDHVEARRQTETAPHLKNRKKTTRIVPLSSRKLPHPKSIFDQAVSVHTYYRT